MRLLDSIQGEKILAVIKTVCAPACDSEIAFYNTVWQKISGNNMFVKPSAKEFLNDSVLANDSLSNELAMIIDLDFANMTFVDGKAEVSVTVPLEELLPELEYKYVKPYIRQTPIIYEWKGGRFVKK
jgi:Protein of unknown function (DUF3256).